MKPNKPEIASALRPNAGGDVVKPAEILTIETIDGIGLEQQQLESVIESVSIIPSHVSSHCGTHEDGECSCTNCGDVKQTYEVNLDKIG